MRAFIATIAAAAYVGSALVADSKVDLNAPVVTEDMVSSINSNPKSTWRAAMPSGKHAGITHRDFRRLLGVRPETEEDKKLRATFPVRSYTEDEKKVTTIPVEFDAAKQWPQCQTIPHIYDQSRCGSCWAVAAASAMSDRYCVAGQYDDLFISSRDLISCGWGLGCNGGNPLLAWSYWTEKGLVSAECQPYPFVCGGTDQPPCPDSYPTPPCVNNCTADSLVSASTRGNINYTKYYGNSSYVIWGEENYQLEILKHGPMEVAFTVYEDFMSYKSGVYTHVNGTAAGGHAVRLVGWGVTEDGTKFWKCANSWNSNWGMDGYFLIKRGVNECNIELSGTAGVPRPLA